METVVSSKLLDAAQFVMDSYYQDFAPDDSFFRLEDFAHWLAIVYGKDADDVAQMIYKNSLGETGQGQITFNQDWWAFKDFDVKNKDNQQFIELDIKYLGFTYDTQNSGIQLVTPIGINGNCGNFERTSLTELWKLNHHTMNSIVWWYPNGDLISFKVASACKPKKVRVWYLPAVDDENFKLPSSREFIQATTAWQFMIQAKTGTPFSDRTNDSNPDITPQTEANSQNLKPLRS